MKRKPSITKDEVLGFIEAGTIFYIYEIVDKKIGVTTNVKRRVTAQGSPYNYQYRILETHTDIFTVSDREKQLQREYGYKIDGTPYWRMFTYLKRGQRAIICKYGSLSNAAKLRLPSSFTKESINKAYHTNKINKTGCFDPRNLELARSIQKEKGLSFYSSECQKKLSAKANARTILCPDNHITTPASYKRYCLFRGLDPALAVKLPLKHAAY